MADPAEKLTPVDARDLADALAFALRFQGRKRVDNADEIMAEIVAKRLRRTSGTSGLRGDEEAARDGHGGAATGLQRVKAPPPLASLQRDRANGQRERLLDNFCDTEYT
jgi:hypothetical protein